MESHCSISTMESHCSISTTRRSFNKPWLACYATKIPHTCQSSARRTWLPSSSSSSSSSLSSARMKWIVRSSSSSSSLSRGDDGFLQWQPALRFDSEDLLTDAPFLRSICDDLDWKTEACHLRDLAKLSLQIIEEDDGVEDDYGGSVDPTNVTGSMVFAIFLQCCVIMSSACAETTFPKVHGVEETITQTSLLLAVIAFFTVYSSKHKDQVLNFVKHHENLLSFLVSVKNSAKVAD